jgi:hypothetical protein
MFIDVPAHMRGNVNLTRTGHEARGVISLIGIVTLTSVGAIKPTFWTGRVDHAICRTHISCRQMLMASGSKLNFHLT